MSADDLCNQVTGFKEEHGIDLTRDHLALQRLHEAAETAKVSADYCYHVHHLLDDP